MFFFGAVGASMGDLLTPRRSHLEAELLCLSGNAGSVGMSVLALPGMMFCQEQETVRVQLVLQAPAVKPLPGEALQQLRSLHRNGLQRSCKPILQSPESSAHLAEEGCHRPGASINKLASSSL
jgi:hypothetical protein